MVARLIKLICSVALIAFTGACAGQDEKTPSEQALTLALQRFESDKKALEERIEHCEAQKEGVPPEVFNDLNLSKKHLKIALFVLASKAEDHCEGETRARFVMSAEIYRATAEHYAQKSTPATPYTEGELFGHYWKRLEFEAQYLAIDEEARNKLEAIPETKKPFDLIKTLEGIGAM